MRRCPEWSIVLTSFLAVSVLSYFVQDRVTRNDGKGWDGVQYHQMAQQIADHQPPAAEAPFVYRLGTPFLAAFVPVDNLLNGFLIVNLIASFLLVFLVWSLLKRHIPSKKVRVAFVIMFMLTWHQPVRFTHFYPAYTDPVALCFLVAGLLMLASLQARYSVRLVFALTLLTAAGVFFREVVFIIAVATPFVDNPIKPGCFHWPNCREGLLSRRVSMFLPLIGGACALLACRYLGTQTNNYEFYDTAVGWAWNKPLPSYLLAWYMAYVSILLLAIYNFRGSFTFLLHHQHLLVVFASCAVLAYIGGTDSVRFLAWGLPVSYVLAARSLEDHPCILRSLPLAAFLLLVQVLSQRMLWPIPDHLSTEQTKWVLLTCFGAGAEFLDLHSFWAARHLQNEYLKQYILVTGILLFWIHGVCGRRETNQALD